MKLGKKAQTPTENKLYTVDYSQWLSSGETLSTVTFGVTPATSPAFAITNYAIAQTPTSLSFYAGGGVDSNTYEVTITVTTSLSETKEDTAYFLVKNP